ncbi:MAG: ABC transporter substrate-binding protein [Spirochaetales bacterium]|nr:ABC transporter substrate-binding protein [Spirochaetales bacterium]
MSHKSSSRKGWVLFAWIIAASLMVSGCDNAKVYRVGVIKGGPFSVIFDGFKDEMTALGYVEGRNIVYDAPDSGPDITGAPVHAKKFVADKVDLIFVSGSTPGAIAAKAATDGTSIPVVFAYAATEGTGVIKTVREPGGNLTGVRYPGHEMIIKRLELLHEIAANVKRVWVGYDTSNPNTATAVESLRLGAQSIGLTLVEVPATRLDQLKADLETRAAKGKLGIDAIIQMPDGLNMAPDGLKLLSAFAAKHKIPLAGSLLYTVQAGAVFGNANDLPHMGKLAAPLADKILRGASPAMIPVVTPEQDLYFNYKAAEELGLTIPEGLLKMAAQIIK